MSADDAAVQPRRGAVRQPHPDDGVQPREGAVVLLGVWQVGGASSVPIHEMVKLDTGYVDIWSLWTDVRLIVVTAAHVVMRKGL